MNFRSIVKHVPAYFIRLTYARFISYNKTEHNLFFHYQLRQRKNFTRQDRISSFQIIFDSYLSDQFYPNSSKRKNYTWQGEMNGQQSRQLQLYKLFILRQVRINVYSRKTCSRDGCFARVSRIANRLHFFPPSRSTSHDWIFSFFFFFSFSADRHEWNARKIGRTATRAEH